MDQLATQKIAHKYAKALLEAASETNAVDPVNDVIQQLERLYLDVPTLNSFFANPAIPAEEKKAIIEKKFQKGVQPLVANLLTLVAENDRLALLPDILSAFMELMNERNGIVKADVTVPVAIDTKLEKKLKQNLEAVFGYSQVDLHITVDPGILAGAIVKIGDKLIDGSYHGKLEMLRRQIG